MLSSHCNFTASKYQLVDWHDVGGMGVPCESICPHPMDLHIAATSPTRLLFSPSYCELSPSRSPTSKVFFTSIIGAITYSHIIVINGQSSSQSPIVYWAIVRRTSEVITWLALSIKSMDFESDLLFIGVWASPRWKPTSNLMRSIVPSETMTIGVYLV